MMTTGAAGLVRKDNYMSPVRYESRAFLKTIPRYPLCSAAHLAHLEIKRHTGYRHGTQQYQRYTCLWAQGKDAVLSVVYSYSSWRTNGDHDVVQWSSTDGLRTKSGPPDCPIQPATGFQNSEVQRSGPQGVLPEKFWPSAFSLDLVHMLVKGHGVKA